PGQSAATAQPTQAPLPSQRSLLPHIVPAFDGGFDATPPVHTSSVQSLPSLGTSVSSLTVLVFPAPSHCTDLHSPPVCVASGVPSATGAVPHLPAMHVRSMHGLLGSGQSTGPLHSGFTPLLTLPPAPPPPSGISLRSTAAISSQPTAPPMNTNPKATS